jgi:hypothetical protein
MRPGQAVSDREENEDMDLTKAEEIVASDYAHDEPSPELPEAAYVLLAELDRLREVDDAAHAYVRAGLCGNPDTSAELRRLIELARRDF